MQLDERRIQEIVERVMARIGTGPTAPPRPGPAPAASNEPRRELNIPRGRLGVHGDMDSAVKAARAGFEWNERASLETRAKMISAMREATRKHVRQLAEYAVAETGYGRVEDKVNKNLLVAEKTPGTEILRPIAFTGDHGLALIERAPYGVIGAITPTTNPTETILNNGIGMIAGGNGVVFNVHPYAKQLSAFHVSLLNEACQAAAGAPPLLNMLAEPTIESAQAMMKHPGVRLLVVTGGPAVVKEAMNSGKKTIAAGPGNPPAVVDETAHLDQAARGIVQGGSIDNNIICTAEKETVAVASIADKLIEELKRAGCYLLSARQVSQLEKVVLEGNGTNKKWVGKNASLILREIGIHTSDDPRLILCDVEEQHPFVQHELLMPVMPLVRVPDVTSAIATAKRVEHGFGHTAVMYSTNIENMHAMARVINTSIFVKNASNLAGLGYGGEGYTSFTIASPTGEGLTTALNFTRERRCTLHGYFRFV